MKSFPGKSTCYFLTLMAAWLALTLPGLPAAAKDRTEWGYDETSTAASPDGRPLRRVLFIGNSHTHNDSLPVLLRKVLASVPLKEDFLIASYVQGGAYLKHHWQNPEVQQLMLQSWNDVVFQGNGKETLSPSRTREFEDALDLFAQAARKTGATPAVYVTFEYGDASPLLLEKPGMGNKMYDLVQSAYQEAAASSGAVRVNVGQAVHRVKMTHPDLPLYRPDGFHGSLQTQYLAALCFFRYFSGLQAVDSHAAPPGISAEQDAILKEAADNAC